MLSSLTPREVFAGRDSFRVLPRRQGQQGHGGLAYGLVEHTDGDALTTDTTVLKPRLGSKAFRTVGLPSDGADPIGHTNNAV